MAGLGLLVWSGHAQIWQVCVVAFAITAGEILVDPSTIALVPTLVDDADLERANGRISSVEIVTNDFAGVPVGSVLFAFAPWLPFLMDACSYLVIVFGALGAGALATVTNVRWSFAAGGTVQLVGAVVMWVVLARLDDTPG